jgi:hypothetical protein
MQNPNFPMIKTVLIKHPGAWSFGHSNFENLGIASDFDIRISDFP